MPGNEVLALRRGGGARAGGGGLEPIVPAGQCSSLAEVTDSLHRFVFVCLCVYVMISRILFPGCSYLLRSSACWVAGGDFCLHFSVTSVFLFLLVPIPPPS